MNESEGQCKKGQNSEEEESSTVAVVCKGHETLKCEEFCGPFGWPLLRRVPLAKEQ